MDLYPLLASIELAIALDGSVRRGERGISRSGRISALAGLDSGVIYEQVDDCRSRKATSKQLLYRDRFFTLCHSRVSGNPEPRHVRSRPSLDARFRGHDTDVSESSPHFQ
jgi:hypothetical protein